MAHDNDNADYTGILLEEVRDDLRTVMEAEGDIQQKVRALPEITENTHLLMDDNQVLKAAVRELSNEVGGLSEQMEYHEHRISRLEGA